MTTRGESIGGSGPSEADLVERVAQGDEAALGRLMDRYHAMLAAYARRRLAPAVQRRVSAADVVQEAGIVALRRIADFEGGSDSSFRRWMLRIVRYKAQEAVQRHAGAGRRAVGREVSRGRRPETRQFLGDGDTPSQLAMASELQTRAQAVMQRLPDHYREVLRMARMQQLTLREIAERLGRSREAVKKTYARALARFHEELGSAPTDTDHA